MHDIFYNTSINGTNYGIQLMDTQANFEKSFPIFIDMENLGRLIQICLCGGIIQRDAEVRDRKRLVCAGCGHVSDERDRDESGRRK